MLRAIPSRYPFLLFPVNNFVTILRLTPFPRFANGAGGVFSVPGPKVGRDSALLTGAVNVAWSRYSAYVAYQADLGRTNYESHTVLAGLRVSF